MIQSQRIRPTQDFIEFQKHETEQSIPARFEQQVRRYPQRIALKTRTHELSYEALNELANRTAQAILAQSGEGEEPVALLLEHGAPVVAALLGALKAGKIYVPLEPTYPSARLSYVLGDSQARLIVTNTRNRSMACELARGAVPVLDIDELQASISPENLGLSLSPDRLACILYTSGTTGEPKGVVQNHRNLLYEALRLTNSYRVRSDDRLELFHSCSFSASFRKLLPALLNGAALYPLNVREEKPGELVQWLVQEGVTICSGRLLLNICRSALTGPEQFPQLRLITFGGDTVYRSDVERYRKYLPPDCLMVNGLAATETGTDRQYFLDKETPVTGNIVPVGYPVDGTEILLLDEVGEGVGANGVGEIAVRSRYLPPGYWRKPDLTRAAFLPDPAGGEERIYRTGDLGCMLPDGCLVHLGRKDSRVKVRGFRIELGEIQAALAQHPAVKESTVLAREEHGGEKRVIAYVVAEPAAPSTASELRRFLREMLPEPMVPSSFVYLDAMPRTPTGKIDRKSLPAPVSAPREGEPDYAAPRDALEEQLAKIWEGVLGRQPIGVTTSFFDLGGHSVLAARLIGQLEVAFGRELPLHALFHAPTIAQLAVLLRREAGASPAAVLLPVQPAGSRPPFFCISNLGGGIDYYRDLARHLGPEQPLYALHPADPLRLVGSQAGRFCVETRIRDTAAHYLQEIRALQPEGPYCLGGHCLGGTIAFELAHQLHAQGQQVALLALFQPSGLAFHLSKRQRMKVRYHLTTLFHLPPEEKLRHARQLAFSMRERAVRLPHRVAPGLEMLLPPRLRSVWRLQLEVERDLLAGRCYQPQRYAGRAALFWPSERPEELYREVIDRWRALAAGGLELHTVPGSHATMVAEPHIRVLAEKLSACLEQSHEVGTGVPG